ncbi:MAG: glycosyltransferase family 4 protein [Psychrilyobacter sp.]|uniref:glycosyltransferase family 4 protein n=1 Tax=Psychrilyobacter sp. TaxID=2586924 RepID=UPI003C72F8F9
MKIGILFVGNPNAKNGASKVVKEIYENFIINSKIKVVNLYSSNIGSITTHRKNKNLKRNFEIKKLLEKNYLFNIISIYLQYFRNGRKAVKNYLLNSKKDEDVLLFHDIFSIFYYYKFVKKAKKSVLVIHSNGDTWKMLLTYFPKVKNTLFEKYLRKIEKQILLRVEKIIFVSDASKSLFLKLYPFIDPQKVKVIHNGIEDKSNYKIVKNKENYNLICVATINERKGQDIIVSAYENLEESLKSRLTITFAGDGPGREKLENAVRKKELKKITFLGSIDNVGEQLRKNDIYILMSYDEGLPIAIIEALREGLPIISTNVGGIPELVKDRCNGFLLSPNKNELKVLFKDILSGKFNIEELSENSRKLFEKKYITEKMIERYIYELNG